MALSESPRVQLPDLGEKGEAIAPIVEAYRALGVTVSSDAISQLRLGTTSGAEINRAIAAVEIVRKGNVSPKDVFFKEYGVLGITKRKKPTNGQSRAFIYQGLKQQLTVELGVTDKMLGDLVKGLRIDLFYTPADQLGVAFPANFRDAAEVFLRDLGKYKNKAKAQEIDRKWNRTKTVRNFYGIILNQPKDIIASWLPYEMEPIRTLAVNRLSRKSPITLLLILWF